MERRVFLRTVAHAGGGLALALYLPGCGSGSEPGGSTVELNPVVRIDPDGSVVITAPRPEMGQGVRTSLPMLVAEELAVDWRDVSVVQADLNPAFDDLGGQSVGGSFSVRGSWRPMRTAGAAVREMLISAAAARWGVAVGECRAAAGRVHHRPTERSLEYGDLASAAAELPVPETPDLMDQFRIVGRPTPSVDTVSLVRGEGVFGVDVRPPGLRHAAILHAPVFGARLGDVSDGLARSVPGVTDVVEIDTESWPDFPPNSPKPPSAVVVVAENTWAALRGREALEVSWEGGATGASTAGFWKDCRRRVGSPPDRILRDDGDVDRAMSRASERLRSTYRMPFLAHVPMEPMNATACVENGRCEIWAPTQNPKAAREAAALVTGLPPSSISVHPVRMGGAFGRRYYSDYVAEAAYVAREVGGPVQVMWTREEDVRHGFYRPAGLHEMEGGVDDGGRVTAWSHHLANASRYTYLGREDGPPGAGELYPYDFPAGFVEHFRMAYSAVSSPIPRGQWRAIAASANVFAVESFLDEMAHASGSDPLEFRLRLIGEPREVPFFSTTYDSGRLRGVLELAAERAGWGGPLPAGRGRGVAASFANSAFVAHVVEAGVDDDGSIVVDRVVSAVDIGIVVNPLGARAQVEGSVIQGISAALGEELHVEGGGVVQGNYDDYSILRIDRCPDIEVHFVDSDRSPRGIGEGALPPTAPALLNAVFAATGVRIRELPARRLGSQRSAS